MTLATRCPKCQTTFKVVADQLKLRRGLVRCGVCRHIFSGDEHLTDGPAAGLAQPVEPRASRPAPIPESITSESITSESITSDSITSDSITSESITSESIAPESTAPESITPASTVSETGQTRPAWRIPADETAPATLRATAFAERDLDAPRQAPVLPKPPASAAGGIDTKEDWGLSRATAPEPANDSEPRLFAPADNDEQDAVDFFATNRKARGFASRGQIFAALASFVLMLTLTVQLTIGARDWIAARIPFANSFLSAALTPLGLQVLPPRELRALTIESFELQSTGVDGLLALNALLRNAAAHRVQWPAMELSLNDASGKVVVRRVLMPADYLAPQASERNGIAPRAEQPVRTGLRAQGLAVTAYSVKLFYP